MAEPPEADRAPGDGRRGHGWLAVLVPAVTFLVGLGLGLAIMVATGGDTPEAVVPTEEPTTTAGADDSSDTVVRVTGACEEAARNLAEATQLLDDVAASVRDFQPDELVDLLEQLEELDGETRALAGECSAAVEGGSASPSPTP